MICSPNCIPPTLKEARNAAEQLRHKPYNTDLTQCIREIHNGHPFTTSDEDIIIYKFEHTALAYLENLHEIFHENLKEALTEGKPTPATKSIELIQRVAASLFVLDNSLKTVINGGDFTFPTEIRLEAVKRAAAYVHHLESQKEIIVKVRNVSILL